MKSMTDGLSPMQVDELVAEATDFVNSLMITKVREVVRENIMQRLAAEPTYSLTAVDAHASLRVLEAVLMEIGLVVVNSKKSRKL